MAATVWFIAWREASTWAWTAPRWRMAASWSASALASLRSAASRRRWAAVLWRVRLVTALSRSSRRLSMSAISVRSPASCSDASPTRSRSSEMRCSRGESVVVVVAGGFLAAQADCAGPTATTATASRNAKGRRCIPEILGNRSNSYNDYNSAADCYVPYGRGWGRDPILRRKAGLGPRPGRRRAPGSAELRLAAASAVTGKVCALRDMPSGGRAVVGARDDAVVVVSGSGSAPKGDEGRPQSASEQNSACSEVVGGRSGGASCCWAAPPSLLFGADFGSPFAFQAQDLRVPGVGVAPAEVGVDPSGQHGVVEVVGVVEHELPQRPEVRLDRIGPGAVGGRKAQFDVVLGAPRLDLLGLVGREVVQDDVDH